MMRQIVMNKAYQRSPGILESRSLERGRKYEWPDLGA